MAVFLIRRIGHGILVLWLITVAVFALFFVAPSNVAQTLAGRQATPETIALIKHRLGLDLPVWKQYLHFLEDAVQGNQLERCQEEIDHTRHDVQVRQPCLFHVAMVELILRHRARGQVGHVKTNRLPTE